MSEVRIRVEERPPRVIAVLRGRDRPVPALWLRERSPDARHLDPQTQQRLFDPLALPDTLALTGAAYAGEDGLWLAFSDGYSGRFDLAALGRDLDPFDGCPEPRAWDATLDPLPVFSWRAAAGDRHLWEILHAYLSLGFVILRGVPTGPGSVLPAAECFGYVRETNFGRMFTVRHWPAGNDLAYSGLRLAPHTDNPYRNPVPSIQLLLCVDNETLGGLSTLVDSLAVGAALRQSDPDAFDLLTRVPVRFRFVDGKTDMIEHRPLITCDLHGRMTGAHFSPRLDYAPLMDAADYRRFFRARAALGRLFADPRFELTYRLKPGEMVMFDNRRLLHGRTAFDPREGSRRLEGCYIESDGPRSLYRVLSRRRAERAGVPVAVEAV